MKKRSFILTLLAIAATFGLLVSCNKTEKKIIGSWECTSAELINPEEGEYLTMAGANFTFRDDNTVTLINTQGDSVSGTYTISEDELAITYDYNGWTSILDMDIQELSKTKLDVEGAMILALNGATVDTDSLTASFKKL